MAVLSVAVLCWAVGTHKLLGEGRNSLPSLLQELQCCKPGWELERYSTPQASSSSTSGSGEPGGHLAAAVVPRSIRNIGWAVGPGPSAPWLAHHVCETPRACG